MTDDNATAVETRDGDGAGEGPECDERALGRLLYAELRRLAAARMRRLPPGQTLQPTALVHEAYLRLSGHAARAWNGRGHFFGAAAQAMRDVLVEEARRKMAHKRGGGRRRVDNLVTLSDGAMCHPLSAEEVLALHRALARMEESHPEAARIVLLRYFGGLTMDEIASALAVSTRTVERKWRFARAWLGNELAPAGACVHGREAADEDGGAT